MQQATVAHYKVVNGEEVTLEIKATKTNNPCAVSLDGSALNPNAAWKYKFVISKQTGSQALGVNCSFDATAAADASYAFTLTGDKGGGTFQAGDVEAGDPDWTAGFTFFL